MRDTIDMAREVGLLDGRDDWSSVPEEYMVCIKDFEALVRADEREGRQLERNFCERCGKRIGGDGCIHTCTPPAVQPAPVQCWKCGDMDVQFQACCKVPTCGMKENT